MQYAILHTHIYIYIGACGANLMDIRSVHIYIMCMHICIKNTLYIKSMMA